MSCLFNKIKAPNGTVQALSSVCPLALLTGFPVLFLVCFILREIFDELLETEKNSQALSTEVGKTTRQAL